MDSEICSDVAVCLGFDEGHEYYDGDSAVATLSFYQDETAIDKFVEGMIFSLRVLDLEIATGRVLSVSR